MINGKCCLARTDGKDLEAGLGLALLICNVCQGHGVRSKSTVQGPLRPERKLTGRAEQASPDRFSGLGISGDRSLTHRAARGPADAAPSALSPPGQLLKGSAGKYGSLPACSAHRLGHCAQGLWLMQDTEVQKNSHFFPELSDLGAEVGLAPRHLQQPSCSLDVTLSIC